MTGALTAGEIIWPELPVRVNADAGPCCFWDHDHRMAWQRGPRGEKYYREQRETLRPREFLRLHRSEWSSSETGLDIGEWDAAVAYYRAALASDPGRVDIKIALQRATLTASAEHMARAKDLEAQEQWSARYRKTTSWRKSSVRLIQTRSSWKQK